jgi:hypothetical protein
MSKWEAIAKVVQSFNAQKRPGYALLAVMWLSLPFATIVMMLVAIVRLIA